jgi:multiple sugar transport system permease protein
VAERQFGYWSQPLAAYADAAVWESDPKIAVFATPWEPLYWNGYKGPITEAAGTVNAEYVLVQMVASVAPARRRPSRPPRKPSAAPSATSGAPDRRRHRAVAVVAAARLHHGIDESAMTILAEDEPMSGRPSHRAAGADLAGRALFDYKPFLIVICLAGNRPAAGLPELSARPRHLARLHRHHASAARHLHRASRISSRCWHDPCGGSPAVWNTLLYTGVATVGKFGLGLWLALLLNNHLPFKSLLRAHDPAALDRADVLSAIAFWWIYDPQFSIISYLLVDVLGWRDTNIDFLGSPWPARFSLIAANIWRGIPFVAISLLAGLQTISPSLYEAAMLDGATAWQRFRYITLPMLMPILAIVMTFSVMFTFTDFQLVYAITRGGPVNSTHLMATLAFQRGIPAASSARVRRSRSR